jgi:hypothetical protein
LQTYIDGFKIFVCIFSKVKKNGVALKKVLVITNWYKFFGFSVDLFIERMPSSGVLRCVVLARTDVSEESIASIIKVTRRPILVAL